MKEIELYTQYLDEESKRREFSSLSSYRQLDELSGNRLEKYASKAFKSADKLETQADKLDRKIDRREKVADLLRKVPLKIAKSHADKLDDGNEELEGQAEKLDAKSHRRTMSAIGAKTKAQHKHSQSFLKYLYK